MDIFNDVIAPAVFLVAVVAFLAFTGYLAWKERLNMLKAREKHYEYVDAVKRIADHLEQEDKQ